MEEHLLQEPASMAPAAVAGPTWLERLMRRAVHRRLSGFRHGRLTVVDWAGRSEFGQVTERCSLRVRVTVRDPSTYVRVAAGGTIGAGEAYFLGGFDTNDLTGLVRLFVVNREVMQGMEGGTAWLRRPLHKLAHVLNRHDRAGSRRNIAAHYDLGNDFFRRFLDREHGMYSSAVFEHPQATLEDAAAAKLERICRKLGLTPQDHVLDIGGGWGGFSVYAAGRYGCRVTMTTISPAQFDGARARVAAAGLEDRVTVLLQDYRDLTGQYDKLVSIEMIEAIGHDAHAAFFAACERLLKPGGTMVLQAITMAEPYYRDARRDVDFIQRYIFPGGALPSVGSLSRSIGEAAGLVLTHLEDQGLHYARTLRHWRERVHWHWPAFRAEGYEERFLRMWDFYLAYCEGGFQERSIGLVQACVEKPAPVADPGPARPFLAGRVPGPHS